MVVEKNLKKKTLKHSKYTNLRAPKRSSPVKTVKCDKNNCHFTIQHKDINILRVRIMMHNIDIHNCLE